MNSECDNLDAYLDADLSADEASRFRLHLDRCADCRGAVEQQGWIDGLLRSPERAQLETPPAALIRSVHESLVEIRQRTRRVTYGLAAAAAVIIVAVGWTMQLNRNPDRAAVVEIASNQIVLPQDVPSSKVREAVVIGSSEMIVVPVASRHPDVTVVRVFQTYQPEISTHASTEQPPATDDFVWPDDFSGG